MELAAIGERAADNWPGAEKLNLAQELLEINRVLIHEINNNHIARTPDNLARNVVLIRELNSNIMKVVHIYEDLSEFLSHIGGEGAAAQLSNLVSQAKQ